NTMEHDTCIWHVIVWFVKDEGLKIPWYVQHELFFGGFFLFILEIFFVKCAMGNHILSCHFCPLVQSLKWNCALIRALIFILDITYYIWLLAEGNTPSIYHISLRAFLMLGLPRT
ncbi:hypothetical protein ACJX0J_024105, partial [Zea mays]